MDVETPLVDGGLENFQTVMFSEWELGGDSIGNGSNPGTIRPSTESTWEWFGFRGSYKLLADRLCRHSKAVGA